MSTGSYPRIVLRRDEWPRSDQEHFAAGLQGGDIVAGETYAAELRPTTLRNSIRGYGRFLGALRGQDPASLALAPTDRITPARMRLFLEVLRNAGNTNNTIKARFMELRSALRIMAPEQDFSWVTKPGGTSLHMLLPTVRKPIPLMGIGELTHWGHDLMEQGLHRSSRGHAELFRNGLLIAMLADRAPRQRSLSLLRVGDGIRRHGAEYVLAFSAEETKGKRRLEYGLHPSLTPRIEHYLAVERPRLLGSRAHDWFWVNKCGKRLTGIAIDGVLRRASMARYGTAFGTHRFRYALATAAMIAHPTSPGLIAAVLGNSPAVTEKHYVLGGQVEAARSLHATLAHLRADEDS